MCRSRGRSPGICTSSTVRTGHPQIRYPSGYRVYRRAQSQHGSRAPSPSRRSTGHHGHGTAPARCQPGPRPGAARGATPAASRARRRPAQRTTVRTPALDDRPAARRSRGRADGVHRSAGVRSDRMDPRGGTRSCPAGTRLRRDYPVPVVLHLASGWGQVTTHAGGMVQALPDALMRAAATFTSARPACGRLAAAVQQRLVSAQRLRETLDASVGSSTGRRCSLRPRTSVKVQRLSARSTLSDCAGDFSCPSQSGRRSGWIGPGSAATWMSCGDDPTGAT